MYNVRCLITARKQSLRRLCFYTCLSVHTGGTWAGTPPSHGGTRYTPPGAMHAGRYGQQADGTHPTGLHSC